MENNENNYNLFDSQESGHSRFDGNTEPYLAPQQPEHSGKKSGKGLRTALALVLAAALVGGGSGITYGIMSSKLEQQAEANAAAITQMQKKIATLQTTPADTVGYVVEEGAMSPKQIYQANASSVVAISSTVEAISYNGQSRQGTSTGSGFILTDDGYVVTNYHVIEPACKYNYKITVLFKDGTSYDASVTGFEEDSDVAVLKIDANDLSPVSIGNSDNIAVGDSVFAIGHPLGELDFSMTSGRVSALDRSITADRNSAPINMFQFDAAINSGNSGGPVFNESGEVIGIATAKVGSSGVEGLGFAIPINDAADIANELITKGYVSGKAYLGVDIDTRYTSVYAQYYNLPEGAYVYNVESGSCAEKCGLAAGDIITQLGDNSIGSYSDLNAAIKQFKSGESVEIVVYRANEYVTLTVTFDESRPNTGSNGVNEFGLSSHPQTGAAS